MGKDFCFAPFKRTACWFFSVGLKSDTALQKEEEVTYKGWSLCWKREKMENKLLFQFLFRGNSGQETSWAKYLDNL